MKFLPSGGCFVTDLAKLLGEDISSRSIQNPYSAPRCMRARARSPEPRAHRERPPVPLQTSYHVGIGVVPPGNFAKQVRSEVLKCADIKRGALHAGAIVRCSGCSLARGRAARSRDCGLLPAGWIAGAARGAFSTARHRRGEEDK